MNEETGRRNVTSKSLGDSLSHWGRVREPGHAAVLRSSRQYPSGVPRSASLLHGNEIVTLTPKAFEHALVLLVRNSGHLLEKDELIRMLWPDTFVEDGSLSNNIFLLRKALGEDPAFIETVPRRGYRFIGAVWRFPDGGPGPREELRLGSPPPDAPLDLQPRALGVATIPTKARPLSQNRAAAGIAVMVVLALVAAALWLYRSAAGRGPIDSVAVLPFDNTSGDPNAEYLSDGIAESLINSLSQLPHLKVMSRDSAFHYRGKETDARTCAGQVLPECELFSRVVVVQQGDTLAISAELIDARDNSHIWGQQYSRKPSDIFALAGKRLPRK